MAQMNKAEKKSVIRKKIAAKANSADNILKRDLIKAKKSLQPAKIFSVKTSA